MKPLRPPLLVGGDGVGDHNLALALGKAPLGVGAGGDLRLPGRWTLPGDGERSGGQLARVGAGGEPQGDCRGPQRMGEEAHEAWALREHEGSGADSGVSVAKWSTGKVNRVLPVPGGRIAARALGPANSWGLRLMSRGTAQPDCHECRMNTAIRLHSPYVS